jgi:Protein of unknown function (DUF2795)
MDEATYINEDLPIEELPDYLQGLEWPVTKDDAIAHAAEYGAPAEVLEYMERLPAAVYTSERGLKHAFSALESIDLGELVTLHDEEDEAEDGTSS